VLKLVHSVTDVIDGPLQPNGRDETLSQGRRAVGEVWQLRVGAWPACGGARDRFIRRRREGRPWSRWKLAGCQRGGGRLGGDGRGVAGDGVRFEKAMVAETADSCRGGRGRCFEASRPGIVHDEEMTSR
jgi:hypothetical protein